MVISSQATQECVEGSTTRVYNPDRIMRPQERTATKVCTKCRANPVMSGTSPWCNPCKAAHMRQKSKDPEYRATVKVKNKAYYKNNRGRVLSQKAAYGKTVAEREKARRRERYATDPAFKVKTKARTKRYYDSNTHRFRARDAARRASQIMATPSWASHEQIREFYKQAKTKTLETGIPHEVDHIIPLRGKSVCGLHCQFNLRVITGIMNRKKFNRLVEDIV